MNLGTLTGNYRRLRSDLKGMFTVASAVPEFFSDRISLQRAKEEIKRALDDREERFLDLVHARVYERPISPYLKLLKFAGCEFSDLQVQVRRWGVEETLKQLAWEGVYFTSEEFKGKKEVVRGRQSFRVTPRDFDDRDSSVGYQTQSSGTTNPPIRSFVSLDLLATRTPVTCLFFAAHNLFSHAHAMYDAILPGSAGINNLMIYARMGVVADRWFARKIRLSNKVEAIYHYLTTQFLVAAAKHFGPGFPKPEFVEIDEIDQIIDWVAGKQRQKEVCCITRQPATRQE